MRRIALMCLAFGLLVAACDANNGPGDQDSTVSGDDPAPTEAPGATTTVAQATPEPTETPTPEPTATTAPTATPEPTPTSAPEPSPTETVVPTVITATLPDDCIDINTASTEQLREIIHIDEDRSEQIVSMRPFSSIDDLVRVNGIANERLQDIRRQGIACASPQ